MKLVIDINEHIYEQVMADSEVYVLDNEVDRILIENAIYNGIPLPEHHGDLIDRNELLDESYQIDSMYCAYDEVVKVDDIKNAPTIIEGSESDDE